MLVCSSSSPGFGKRGLMPLEGCIIDESLKVTDMHFKNDQTRRHVPIHCAPHKHINYFGICYFSCKKRSIRGCRPHPFPNEAVPRIAVIRFQQEQAPAVALLVPLKQAEKPASWKPRVAVRSLEAFALHQGEYHAQHIQRDGRSYRGRFRKRMVRVLPCSGLNDCFIQS